MLMGTHPHVGAAVVEGEAGIVMCIFFQKHGDKAFVMQDRLDIFDMSIPNS